jgi:hypothetical protein
MKWIADFGSGISSDVVFRVNERSIDCYSHSSIGVFHYVFCAKSTMTFSKFSD